MNPVQLKKSCNAFTQRLIRTIEKKDKEKNIIISMNKGHKDVLLFLQEINMANYFDDFINNGINNKEKLLYLTNDNLKLLNIPYAHRFRILKKLKESKNFEKMKKDINEKGKLSKIKLKKDSKYEEIIIPKEEDDKEIDNEEMKKTFTQAIYDFQKTHTSFNDTLIKDDENFINKEEDEDNLKENEKIDNIESTAETGEYIEDKYTIDNSNNVQQLLPINSKKILCYYCLKIVLNKDYINKYDKLFCSNNCLMQYESINYIKCKVCSKKMKKIDSLPSFNNRNVYYCSLVCLEQIEPEKKNWIKKNLIDEEEVQNSFTSEKKFDVLDF